MSNAPDTIPVPEELIEVIAARTAEMVVVELDALARRKPPVWMSVERATGHMGCFPERLGKAIARRGISFHQEAPRFRVPFPTRREAGHYLIEDAEHGRRK
jgi:hypothetical protein